MASVRWCAPSAACSIDATIHAPEPSLRSVQYSTGRVEPSLRTALRAVRAAHPVVERRGDPEGDGVVRLPGPVRDVDQLDRRPGDDLHDVDLAARLVVAQFLVPLDVEHRGQDLLQRWRGRGWSRRAGRSCTARRRAPSAHRGRRSDPCRRSPRPAPRSGWRARRPPRPNGAPRGPTPCSGRSCLPPRAFRALERAPHDQDDHRHDQQHGDRRRRRRTRRTPRRGCRRPRRGRPPPPPPPPNPWPPPPPRACATAGLLSATTAASTNIRRPIRTSVPL